jgi:hypothetical protein
MASVTQGYLQAILCPGHNEAGNTTGCQTVVCLCSEYEAAHIRATSTHDGPSNSDRVGDVEVID